MVPGLDPRYCDEDDAAGALSFCSSNRRAAPFETDERLGGETALDGH